MMRTRVAPLLVLTTLGGAVLACGSAAQNVRAYRAYANEDPSLRVALDRTEDLARTMELVDRILVGTPYTPGDLWVRRLPLIDADAQVIKAQLAEQAPYNTGEYEVPVLKIYRYWIENVFKEYQAPPEKALYPSILDAVAGLTSRTPDVKKHWTAYRDAVDAYGAAIQARQQLADELAGKSEDEQKKRAGELAEKDRQVYAEQGQIESLKFALQHDAELLTADASLDTAEKATVVREGVTALSVAFRIELEALAMAPVIAIQAVRALPEAPQELVNHPSLKAVRQMWQLPSFISSVKERINKQIPVLEAMTNILAKALKEETDDTPGFLFKESVVDQIVGITLDSFRVDLKAGGEAFIYSNVQTAAQQSTGSGSNSQQLDYRGRQFKLDYRVKPIILAEASLSITFDAINLPNAGFLNFGYATDRVYKSGGSIQETSLTSQLGIHGAVSDVIDFGLGILGIRSGVRIASFDAGEVHKVVATDVSQTVSSAPLQLQYTQLDVGYDVLWAVGDAQMKAYMEELVVGFRYVRYTLPRILYELTNSAANPNLFTFTRESEPQNVTSQFYMLGVTGRFGVGEAPRVSPFLDVALYGGLGPSNFYFCKDPLDAGGACPGAHDDFHEAAFVFNGGAGLGLRWRMLPRGARVRLDLRALYRADVIWSTLHRSNSDTGLERKTDFGGVDVFHGPQIAIRGAF
jgi:hypothetical protein